MNSEQRKVRKFYKEFLSWKADNIGLWIASGFMVVFFCVTMLISYEEILENMKLVMFPMLLGFLGPYFYLNPYITFREGTESYSIYERIKYLPIDYHEIQKMRAAYLAKFVGKVFLAVLFFQVFLMFGAGGFTIENVLYVLLIGLVWPFVSNLPIAWFSK